MLFEVIKQRHLQTCRLTLPCPRSALLCPSSAVRGPRYVYRGLRNHYSIPRYRNERLVGLYVVANRSALQIRPRIIQRRNSDIERPT